MVLVNPPPLAVLSPSQGCITRLEGSNAEGLEVWSLGSSSPPSACRTAHPPPLYRLRFWVRDLGLLFEVRGLGCGVLVLASRVRGLGHEV
jgi:hypothetical protein